MQQYDSREERTIDLIDILWKLFIQWKPLVCVMLLCGALVAGIMYARDMRSYQASMEKKELSEDELAKELTDEEIEDVNMAAASYNQWQSLNDYMGESLLLQANPYSEKNVVLDYRITTTDQTTTSVVGLYASHLFSDEAVQQIADAFDYKGDVKYVRELLKISTPDEEANAMNLTVSFVLTEDIEEESIVGAIDLFILERAYPVISANAPHTIDKMAQTTKEIIDTDAVSRITTYQNNLTNLQTSITSATGEFSEVQLAMYESLTGIDDMQDDEEEAEGDVVVVKPSFSVKYALVGLVLGGVLYAGILFMLATFHPAIQNISELKDTYRLYVIDELHAKKAVGAWQRFIYDRRIYALRYRKAGSDTEKSVREAAMQIEGLCNRDGITSLHIAAPGKGFDGGAAGDYLAALKQALNRAGIRFDVLDETRIKDEMLGLKSGDALVLLTSEGDTTHRAIDEICGYAGKYDQNVLGVVALDV